MGDSDHCEEVYDYLFKTHDGTDSLAVWRSKMDAIIQVWKEEREERKADRKQMKYVTWAGGLALCGLLFINILDHTIWKTNVVQQTITSGPSSTTTMTGGR